MDRLVYVFHRPLSYALASGVLVLLAFYLPGAWLLICVSLLPLCYAVSQAKNALHAGLLGTAYGAVIAGGTSFWYFSALVPVESMSETAHFWMVLGSWCLMVLALAPTSALFTVFFYVTQKTLLVLGAPFVFLLSEIARMYAFQLVTFSPGIQNPPFYSTGFLGYPLADSAFFLQFASYGGIYTLSALVIVIHGAFWYLKRKGRMVLIAVVGLCALVPWSTILAWENLDKNTYPLRVGLMSVYVPETERAGDYKSQAVFTEQVRDAVQTLSKLDAEVIILPEDGRFLQEEIIRKDNPGSLVIDVSPVKNTFGIRENVAFSGDTEGNKTVPIRAKQIVTPQGEYVIASAYGVAQVLGIQKQLELFSRIITITPGTWGSGVAVPGTPISASVLFCIEMIAPNFAKILTQDEESEVIFATLSHGRFRDSWLLHVDTRRFLQVRAVEAGVPLFASGDHASAYAIDAQGSIHFATPANTHASQVVELPIPY